MKILLALMLLSVSGLIPVFVSAQAPASYWLEETDRLESERRELRFELAEVSYQVAFNDYDAGNGSAEDGR